MIRAGGVRSAGPGDHTGHRRRRGTVGAEELPHLAGCPGSSGVAVGALRRSTRPGMTRTIDDPVFQFGHSFRGAMQNSSEAPTLFGLAFMPAFGHGQPSRFLSSGHSAEPPAGSGVCILPSSSQTGGAGSLMKNASSEGTAAS